MLELLHVSFSYGKHKPNVLTDVSLTAKDGKCTVLVGENGAGKSTLVGLLAGTLKAKSGNVTHTGRLGYLPQGSALFDDMTARENLLFFAKLYGVPIPSPDSLPFGVSEFLGKRAGELSGGMKKRLSLACMLIGNPDTLLLDEPAASLDAHNRAILAETITDLRAKGKCILYIGHSEEEYRDFCDARYLLSDGTVTEYPFYKISQDCH
ncbi:MAG: ABC transporter ATP-binding protein [Clostridia bacterium]|nr:ABC transporter ATP-binding protein [Clostridia bacterium]